ncbi:MAG: nucleoside triphosphate pyrophosphohydrolase, partial [bacterium]
MTTRPIDQVLEIMRKLRDPEGGCPWDREQNLETLKPFLIEECYEL